MFHVFVLVALAAAAPVTRTVTFTTASSVCRYDRKSAYVCGDPMGAAAQVTETQSVVDGAAVTVVIPEGEPCLTPGVAVRIEARQKIKVDTTRLKLIVDSRVVVPTLGVEFKRIAPQVFELDPGTSLGLSVIDEGSGTHVTPLMPSQPAASEPADLVPAPAARPAVSAKVAMMTVKAAGKTLTTPSATTATSAQAVDPVPAGPPLLTSAIVKQGFQQNVGKASACTNTNIKLASSGPGLFIDHCPSYKTIDGARQVALTVAPDGTVLNARFTDAPTNAHRLGACVLESLKAWRLLPFAGTEPVEILQRVTFEPCIPINGKCVF